MGQCPEFLFGDDWINIIPSIFFVKLDDQREARQHAVQNQFILESKFNADTSLVIGRGRNFGRQLVITFFSSFFQCQNSSCNFTI
jgi:hypothetical protein